jgi:hypothetical protein
MPTVFRPRFPLSEVPFWADRYAYANDSAVRSKGQQAGLRGWYTREDFLAVMLWKTARTQSRCRKNTEASVVEATRLALSTRDERERMSALTALHGVAFPTASVLLHFARPDLYPIIDYRALWSLNVDPPPASYSFEFWWVYTEACRSLAKEAGVPMRTLDRALWQFSKQRQTPARSKILAPHAGEPPRASRNVVRDDSATRPQRAVQGSPPPMTEGKSMPRSRRYPYRADIHARLIETAVNGGTITYSGLGTGRRMVGNYLYRIAKEEQAAGRPPLTALVVHKVDGKPGPGFLEAAKWVGFWREGETEDEVWRRAVEEVHAYWRPKLTDDLE